MQFWHFYSKLLETKLMFMVRATSATRLNMVGASELCLCDVYFSILLEKIMCCGQFLRLTTSKLTRISIWPLDRKTFLITVHIVLCASISICRCTKDMLSEREILWLSEGFYMIEPFIIVGLFSMS